MTIQSQPIEPEADSDGWEWVRRQACPACDFDASSVSLYFASADLRANAAGWQAVLREPQARARPDGGRSPVERGCYVRDRLGVSHQRLTVLQQQDSVLLAAWDDRATARRRAYHTQDPIEVAQQLLHAADGLAAALAQLPEQQWSWAGRRHDGSTVTIDLLVRHTLHEVEHQLRAARARSTP